jgi:predicted esterase
MRLAYRWCALCVVLLAVPGCHLSSSADQADVDGGPAADAAPGSRSDGGDDGGPSGPTRYVDLIFSSEQLVVVPDLPYSTVTDAYGTHRLLLDLYRPGDDDPVSQRPVIVWVHGGNFRWGDRTQLAGYAREFARRGYVTASIEYRLLKAMDPNKGPQESAEVAQEDVDAAIAYLTDHAAEHGMDPTRFIVGGFSAGSITSFQVGYRYEDDGLDAPPVIGVAALDGVLIQPDDFAAGDPPFILIRSSIGGGGNEDCESGDCSAIFTALLDAATALGIATDMVKIPDTTHIDLIDPAQVPVISEIVAPFLYANALSR